MGYQALLFCADEKSAQLVTQVLTELDFSVEPANEPFAAVKRLTTQHFDAVVVDCENEQNASLLFKSARNSGPNKTSLAVAVVEGQPGIAKAFRIGANLVLTKPINVEQSKGTLRVARGLLKKSEAGKPAAAATAAPVAQVPVAPVPAAPARPALNNPAFARPAGPGVSTLKPIPPKSITTKPVPPAVRAEAPSLLELEAEPTPQAESTDAALLASMPDPATPAPAITPKVAWPPTKTGNPFLGGASSGQATGVAPAREVSSPRLEPKPVAFAPVASEPAQPPAHAYSAGTHSSSPILSTPEASGSGAQKWILIAAAIVLAAVGGYFVSTKLHSGSTTASTPTPAAATTTAPLQTAPAQSVPAQDITLGGQSSPASTHPTAPAPAPQAVPVSQGNQPEEASDEDTAETPKKSATAQKPATPADRPAHEPLVVKSSAAKLAQAQAEQPPQAIPVTGLASNTGDKALSGILGAAPTARTPVLKTVKVSQGVSQGLVLRKVSPDYPAQARQLRIEGTVQLEATISKEGNVTNLKVVTGHPILARAAVEAVKQWKYRPYLLNNQAVEIDTQIAVNFKLP
jgi:TonB family protein